VGLQIDTVSLSDHDPEWREIFEQEKKHLGGAFGDEIAGIEHVGSTAVPGLKAKPIIDVVIGVKSLERVTKWAGKLQPEGYVYFGDQKNRGDHFLAKTAGEVETIYLHVVRYESAGWWSYLDFRDRLRENEELRRQYERLKEFLAADFPKERGYYTVGKADFFDSRHSSISSPGEPKIRRAARLRKTGSAC